jgi:hypothetical protein
MPGLTGADGENINGPSLIRVPSWVRKPLGRYYLYFAHHGGKYIRLAYADNLTGPWKVHAGGVLDLKQAEFDNHIASPDVHVDKQNRRILMYYHGYDSKYRGKGYQPTRIAVSSDGLRFESKKQDLGHSYFRVFRWQSACYALAVNGRLYRTASCDEPWAAPWEQGGNPFGASDTPMPRHFATLLEGDKLTAYYSRIGDSPEHLLVSQIKLDSDWRSWHATKPATLLKPEHEYEGADLPVKASVAGAARGRVHELRDPAVYVEGKRRYLLYSVAGESGIAIAQLK